MSLTYVITRPKEQLIGFLMQDDRLVEIRPDRTGRSLLGDIYIGKVKQVVKNINAAFVEIAGGQLCFLPLEDAVDPVLVNRSADGRLLAGDEILVQVKKDAVKTKDPVLSANLSINGRYFSVQTGAKEGGLSFSRKLDQKQCERIRRALQGLAIPGQMTLIVRTRAQDADPELLLRDAARQIDRAQRILEVGHTRTVFSLLSEHMPDYLKPLGEGLWPLPDRIVTDDPAVHTAVLGFLREQGQSTDCLELYRDSRISLSLLYGLSSRLEEALSRQVWLKSGGYLVIEPTEALTVIDVNTGKYADHKPTEETFFLINEEAAKESLRQIRLRNLSGIVLIDFINMKDRENNRRLLSLLREIAASDPVPVKVVDMTPLGLVEITRKKIERPLEEQLCR